MKAEALGDGVRTYTASDYAGFTAGRWEFYYGYEETPEGPIAAIWAAGEESEDGYTWCFVVKEHGREVFRLPILREAYGHDIAEALLYGIGRWLQAREKEASA